MKNRQGVTLIELLLAIVILSITTGMAVPALVRSLRGAGLRHAARAVVMSHRHARATAVLQQAHTALLIDSRGGWIETLRLDAGTRAAPNGDNATAQPAVRLEQQRPLARGVRVALFEGSLEAPRPEVFLVAYQPNGMSSGFTLRLADEEGRTATLRSDPIAGRITVTYE